MSSWMHMFILGPDIWSTPLTEQLHEQFACRYLNGKSAEPLFLHIPTLLAEHLEILNSLNSNCLMFFLPFHWNVKHSYFQH